MTISDVEMIFGVDVDFADFDTDPEDDKDRPAAEPTLILATSTLSNVLGGKVSSFELS